MANADFTQFFRTKHKYPVLLDVNFIVDAANGNGLGVRSVKGPGIKNVFMNTTAAFTGTLNSTVNVTGIASGTATLQVGMPVQGTNIPAGTTIASIVSSSAITLSQAATGSATESITYQGVGRDGIANPNPAAGVIVVQLAGNYFQYFGGFSGFVSPVSGTPISISGSSVLTIGNPYTIVSVGTSTQANWNSVGLPLGITPNVGATFIASVTGGGTGTGIVEAPSVSGISHIEVIGDANQTIGPVGLGIPPGGFIYLQTLGATNSSTTTFIPKAPASGSVIGLAFEMGNSSVLVNSVTT